MGENDKQGMTKEDIKMKSEEYSPREILAYLCGDPGAAVIPLNLDSEDDDFFKATKQRQWVGTSIDWKVCHFYLYYQNLCVYFFYIYVVFHFLSLYSFLYFIIILFKIIFYYLYYQSDFSKVYCVSRGIYCMRACERQKEGYREGSTNIILCTKYNCLIYICLNLSNLCNGY